MGSNPEHKALGLTVSHNLEIWDKSFSFFFLEALYNRQLLEPT